MGKGICRGGMHFSAFVVVLMWAVLLAWDVFVVDGE